MYSLAKMLSKQIITAGFSILSHQRLLVKIYIVTIRDKSMKYEEAEKFCFRKELFTKRIFHKNVRREI